jgi:hypothetical protein
MWFTTIQGDLIQKDRTKIGLTENLGLKSDLLVWQYLASARIENIHVLRLKYEPYSVYDQARNDSYHSITDLWLGYDLDFYMTPQLLFGANVDLDIFNVETRAKSIPVALNVYNYREKETRLIPALGLHGVFYPILSGIALRPNVSGRFGWWNYSQLEAWNWEVAAGVDVPINQLWTWSVNGGYRSEHLKFDRERDTLDTNRNGFFVESSLLF